MKARATTLLAAAVLAALVAGCGFVRARTAPPNPYNAIRTVAVLPVYNATNDVAGAELIRRIAAEGFERMNYRVAPLDEVDSLLKERMGATLGEHLELVGPAEVGALLGVDAVVYCYLLNFDDVMVGFYNARGVRAGFRMVDASSGAVAWAGGGAVKVILVGGKGGIAAGALREFGELGGGLEGFETIRGIEEIPGLVNWRVIPLAVEKFEDAAVLALGTKLLGRVLGVHMQYEAELAVRDALSTLPSGPGR